MVKSERERFAKMRADAKKPAAPEPSLEQVEQRRKNDAVELDTKALVNSEFYKHVMENDICEHPPNITYTERAIHRQGQLSVLAFIRNKARADQ